ncbi:AI-2E family transporter [Pedobacter glucosidilyticus]|uniref:AI-2E family transporter n=1 Tax=Pedobacter glucosidilyticus TaxID=1122941 RepID=UPI00047E8118|nr:AI-2E family transporter [Pedobacter glucosidilyticus]
MSVFTFKQRNSIVLIVLLLLAVIILYSLRDLFTAFLGAIVIYTIFKPLYIYLCKKVKKYVAASAIILLSFLIIILPFFVLSYMIIDKVSSLKQDQFQLKALISRLDDFVGLKLNQPHLVEKYVNKLSLFIQELFPTFVGGAFFIFLALTLMYFVLYFMLVQMDTFENILLKYAPLREHHAKKFAVELRNTTYSNILGQGLIAIVQGLLVSISFFLVGINDAIFWGVLGTFLSFLPVIGAPLITLPAAIILFLNGDTGNAIFLSVFTLTILINIDNVIRFIINKKVADTHPIITVIGVIIGIPMFGFVGLVFGPLLLSWFIHLAEIYEIDIIATERLESHLENKNSN